MADRHAKLFVRSLAPAGARDRQEAVLTDLSMLADRGTLEFEVVVWGEALAVEGRSARTERGLDLLERVAAFQRWADSEGVRLAGDFDTHERGSLAGDRSRVVTFPVMTLAEYDDGELVSVAPYVSDGAVYTVADRVGALAAGETHERPTVGAD